MDAEEVTSHAHIATDYDVIVIGASLNAVPEHLTALLAEYTKVHHITHRNSNV